MLRHSRYDHDAWDYSNGVHDGDTNTLTSTKRTQHTALVPPSSPSIIPQTPSSPRSVILDPFQYETLMQEVRQREAEIKRRMKEKYRLKKKLIQKKAAAVATSSQTPPSTKVNFWLIPLVIIGILFGIWMIWMLTRLDKRTATITKIQTNEGTTSYYTRPLL